MVIRKIMLISLLVLLVAGCDMEAQIQSNDGGNDEMEYSEVSVDSIEDAETGELIYFREL